MATVYYVHSGPFSGIPDGKKINLRRVITEFPNATPCRSKNFPEIIDEKDPSIIEEIVVIEISEDEIAQPDYREAGFYTFPHSHMSHAEAERKLFSNH